MNRSPDLQGTRAFLLELLGIPSRTDDELRAMAAGADWRVALELAGPGLLAMIAYRLNQRRIRAPGWAVAYCGRAQRVSAAMLLRRRAAMRQALAALEQAGLEPVVLKGFVLAHSVYPSPETRTMSDVDLWLRREGLAHAARALAPLGWRQPWWRDTVSVPAGSGGQVGLILSPDSLIIELHGDPGALVDAAPQALEEFWSRRVRVDIGGLSAWTLPAEETLIHLALHLAEHHRFLDAVGRLLDVALVLDAAGQSLAWPAFANRCEGLGISRWVATTIGTSRAMLGAPVPPGALAAFGIADLDSLCADAAEQAWRVPAAGRAPTSVLSGGTTFARVARLQRRLWEMMDGVGPGSRGPRLSPRQLLNRLRVYLQIVVPGFARTLWLNVARPSEGARLRRWAAENEALVRSMRRPPGAAHG